MRTIFILLFITFSLLFFRLYINLMSLFNSKETTYSKIEGQVDPPAYIEATTGDDVDNKGSSIAPQSRFSEPIYFTKDEHTDHFSAQHRSIINTNRPEPARDYCKLLANVSLIIGIALMLISVIFKIQSRSYISQAIANSSCPANCVTTCYRSLPFFQLSVDCDSNLKQICDDECIPAGIDQATTFAILFYVFLGLGASLMVIQIVSTCLRYCCFDYLEYKKKNQIGDISTKA